MYMIKDVDHGPKVVQRSIETDFVFPICSRLILRRNYREVSPQLRKGGHVDELQRVTQLTKIRRFQFEYDVKAEMDKYKTICDRIRPFIVDNVEWINDRYKDGKKILLEGDFPPFFSEKNLLYRRVKKQVPTPPCWISISVHTLT